MSFIGKEGFMKIEFELNGSMTEAEIRDDACLKDTLRELGCASVKCGCDTANCGMCTVLVDDRPMLSCAYLSARANGKKITTLEGLTDEAVRFAKCMAEEGADQCGFCNPGFVMNTIALLRENPDPADDEIKAFLSGNLCRCSGYEGQLRGIRNYLDSRKGGDI